MYGFLADMAKKIYRACKKVWSFSNPRKRWRQDTKNLKLLFCFPLFSPQQHFVATTKSLLSYWLALTVYEQVAIHLTTMRNNWLRWEKGMEFSCYWMLFLYFPTSEWQSNEWREWKDYQKKKKNHYKQFESYFWYDKPNTVILTISNPAWIWRQWATKHENWVKKTLTSA